MPHPPDQSGNNGLDPAWDTEIADRLKDIDEGKVQMVPWEEVMRELREITRGKRRDDSQAN